MISDQRMKVAAEGLFQAMLDSLPDEDQCAADFSPRFERKMKHLIHRAEHPVRYRVLQKVASITLVILIGFATILAVSPTARAAFFGWVKEQYESFTKYYFEGSVQGNPTTCKYELSELPEGFVEFTRDEIPGKTTVYYANYDTNQIMFFVYSHREDDGDFFLKSSDYSSNSVLVNTTTGIFYESNDSNQANALVWSDPNTNTWFCLSAFLDESNIIHIAEKINKIQE